MIGSSSTWVKPSFVQYSARRGASSRYDMNRPGSAGSRIHEPRWTSYVDIGASRAFRPARSRIHSPSPHAYARSHTIDAVFGGVSKNRPHGSDLSTRYPPPRRTTWNLYSVPGPTSGTMPAQIPEAPTGRRGCDPGSQPLRSPTRETASAFGAHTAKCV